MSIDDEWEDIDEPAPELEPREVRRALNSPIERLRRYGKAIGYFGATEDEMAEAREVHRILSGIAVAYSSGQKTKALGYLRKLEKIFG